MKGKTGRSLFTDLKITVIHYSQGVYPGPASRAVGLPEFLFAGVNFPALRGPHLALFFIIKAGAGATRPVRWPAHPCGWNWRGSFSWPEGSGCGGGEKPV